MARPTFEGCDSLDIHARIFARQQPGTALKYILSFPSTRRRPDPFRVTATVDTHSEPTLVELEHVERFQGGKRVRYSVKLVSTAQPFGGVRWWFVCPVTGRPATKLTLPRGGDRFASRPAWALDYACQREGALDAVSRRAGRAFRAIGGIGNWRDGLPPKPGGMRWTTYLGRAQTFTGLVAQHNAIWTGDLLRTLPHLRERVSA